MPKAALRQLRGLVFLDTILALGIRKKDSRKDAKTLCITDKEIYLELKKLMPKAALRQLRGLVFLDTILLP